MGTLILGLSAYSHDSAAALLCDGEIIAAAQEERFTRKRHDAGFPTKAIEYCLHEARAALADVDYVVFYDKPIKFECLLDTYFTGGSQRFASLVAAIPILGKEKFFLKATLEKQLAALGNLRKKELPQLLFTERQQAHAASAFFPSRFQHAAVICLDGVGEGATGSVWLGEGNTLMAQCEIDIAESIQVVTAEIILKLAHTVQRELKTENLCLAGSVALNCVVNNCLLLEGPFKNIWIQPAAGDAGGALGAALAIWHEHLGNSRTASQKSSSTDDFMQGGFLGPWFASESIIEYLDSFKAPYKKLDDTQFYTELSDVLAAEKIVGWFQGRMEFGPSSLGGRSIIGDPRSAKVQIAAPVREDRRIATKVEQQQLFGIKKLNALCSPIQIVHADTNPRLHRLLDSFEQKTGCPMLVNTSFKMRGEPIVCTPEDAYRCFMLTDMDCLVLESIILYKHEQPLWEER